MRLIPITIAFAALLFTVKVVDIFQGTEFLADASLISQAGAETPDDTKKAPEAKREGEAAPKGEHAPEEKKTGKSNKAVSSTPGETVDNRFTKAETELLQNLAKRREELDRWERNIEIKEVTLEATEKRISEKIDKIDAMKKEVAMLLAQYNTQEDTKIRSLVKIYESMKPADAARIFDEIEMPILLLVIDKMSEKKAAPILAQMESRKAKQITVELAAQRRISTKRVNEATSSAKP
ncbi:MAG: hypothetical protein EBR02_03015 [Alphaproteobacteria bacterium]|nr:hypothetical protein [Alphaproteobacteria bacterium]